MAYAETVAYRRSTGTVEPNQPASTTTRAVIYLRVSTKEQAEMGGEVEGYSIPAQREACLRRAAQLGAAVIDEFVDRGESAQSAKRPELQRLLRFVSETNVDYVIVHKVDRLARNRVDDVNINLTLRRHGAQLVSVSENIDETPSGLLLHGIMSSIAEFYSQNLAQEVIKGSTEKAKRGGTVGKAPTGYRNVRRMDAGREVRTVEIDPERGPLMKWAFEQFATGEWTTRSLLETVSDRGLTSTGGPRTSPKPLSVSNFTRLLRNRYYIGFVRYKGVEYRGTHESLVPLETFLRVQAVLDAHRASAEKHSRYPHYLKGTIYCAGCGSRLGVMNARNRHGTVYPYFFCLGRQRSRQCTQPVVTIDVVEAAIERLYSRVALTDSERTDLEAHVRREIKAVQAEVAVQHREQRRRAGKLRDERDKLLQAYYAGAVGLEQLKAEQARITAGLDEAERVLAVAQTEDAELAERITIILDWAQRCGDVYRFASDDVRRLMNQAFFERILVGPETEATGQVASPFRELIGDARGGDAPEYKRSSTGNAVEDHVCPLLGAGSNIDWLVGEAGLEPAHPFGHRNLNPARLPIPPLARVER